jgi:hypothetical protein
MLEFDIRPRRYSDALLPDRDRPSQVSPGKFILSVGFVGLVLTFIYWL